MKKHCNLAVVFSPETEEVLKGYLTSDIVRTTNGKVPFERIDELKEEVMKTIIELEEEMDKTGHDHAETLGILSECFYQLAALN